MPDFSNRSYKKELLDENNIPFDEIKRNMKELGIINKYLGGHNSTIKGIKSLLDHGPGSENRSESLVICEIGCGGGDNLKAIEKWCVHNGISSKFIGIDINADCIAYAKENCSSINAELITSDYRVVTFIRKPDILFSSLFCHHFTEKELAEQFEWMKSNSRLGFFINDLHRHPLAYYSICMLTRIFSKSYLVKNDAPLSVLRGFRKKEFAMINEQSSVVHAELQWNWAFRWLMVVKNEPRFA